MFAMAEDTYRKASNLSPGTSEIRGKKGGFRSHLCWTPSNSPNHSFSTAFSPSHDRFSTKKEAGSLKKTDFRSHFADGVQTIWASQV
ncbi:MAG: hypothetical protein ABSA13_00100 [Beijerinckiaceae bacterium]|jgi:hypothetical protein